MYKGIKFKKTDNKFLIEMEHPINKLKFEIDLVIKDGEPLACWHQNMFNLDMDDLLRFEIQSSADESDDAFASAVCYLEAEDVIYQEKEDYWMVR